MTGVQPPEPVAQGTLEQQPSYMLLAHVGTQRLSGTLAVWPDDENVRGQDRLLFDSGTLIRGRFLSGTYGLLDGIQSLLVRLKAPYAFYEEALVSEGPGVAEGRLDILVALKMALRTDASIVDLGTIFDHLRANPFQLSARAPLPRFEFDAEEQRIVELFRSTPRTLTQLVQASGNQVVSERVVALLALTKGVEIAPEPSSAKRISDPTLFPDLPTLSSLPPPPAATVSVRPAPSAPSQAPRRSMPPKTAEPAAPPPTLTGALRDQWIATTEYLKRIEHQTYFEMLGVDRTVGPDAVKTAYFALVKTWHPDRLPPELGELKPIVGRVFQYLTEAHETLIDETKRPQYLKAVQDGSGTPAAQNKVREIITAAMEFQKIEILMRRREWDEALTRIDAVLDMNSDEADYHATKGWVLFQLKNSDPSAAPEVLTYLDRALQMEPKSENANYYKGLVLKRLSKDAQALEHFQIAAQANPKNIDAVREVRLASMRASTPPKSDPAAKSGILSRLFGKK